MSEGGSEGEYEESFESFSSKSPPKAAPSKGQGEGSDEIKGMDLEQFMGNYQVNIGTKDGEGGPGEDPSLRPLDGLSPDKGETHRAMHKKFGALGESDSSGGLLGGGSDDAGGSKNGRVTSPVDFGAQNFEGDKENNENGNAFDGDDTGRDKQYEDEADVLLERIKNGTLGTGISMPASVEKKLKEKKASLTREYEKERQQLKERMQNLEAQERSEVLSASRNYLENAKQKAATERGPIDAEQLSYYNSLLGEGGAGGGASRKGVTAKKSSGGTFKGKASQITESDVEHERRVDDLLAELLPNRFGSKGNKQKKTLKGNRNPADAFRGSRGTGSANDSGDERPSAQEKSEWTGRREYGLSQPDYNGSIAGSKSSKGGKKHSGELGMGASQHENVGRDEPSMSAQLVHLRKELKGRDDRLQRLTEQSMNLGQLCEKQKMEIVELRKQMNTYEMELEAKEQRASDAARLRKKAQKKAKAMEEELGDYQAACDEIQRLTDREAALLEAVDALSGQNEDLIRKLKQSMARELELTQKVVSDEAGQLSNVQEALRSKKSGNRERDYSPSSPPRAQSDTRVLRNNRKKASASGSGRLPDVASKYR